MDQCTKVLKTRNEAKVITRSCRYLLSQDDTIQLGLVVLILGCSYALHAIVHIIHVQHFLHKQGDIEVG